jgi:2-phospho-L-lactate guanylyltransferase
MIVDSHIGDRDRPWAVVPIKALDRAKSRLAQVLGPEDRRALVLDLLRHTLSVLRDNSELRGIIVVSSDPAVREEAIAQGVTFLPEVGSRGLNDALSQAAVDVMRRGGRHMLVIPGDLPLLTTVSIEALVRAAAAPASSTGRGVVIVPDRAEAGTNALWVTPPDLIPFCFGPDSFRRHVAAAQAVGVAPVVFRSPALAFDLDLPGDLDTLADDGLGGPPKQANR